MNGRKSSNHCRLNPRYLFSYTKVAVPMARNLFRVPVIYGFPLDNIMQWCSSYMLDNNRPIQKEAGSGSFEWQQRAASVIPCINDAQQQTGTTWYIVLCLPMYKFIGTYCCTCVLKIRKVAFSWRDIYENSITYVFYVLLTRVRCYQDWVSYVVCYDVWDICSTSTVIHFSEDLGDIVPYFHGI